MAKPLVIVESPAKARTIARFLGSDFLVESSVGHVRDLPRTAADVPAAYKGEAWARLGVDVEAGFKPLYVVAPEKKQVVTRLRQLLKQADELYLATDEDREGESIAWHLLEVLSPPARVPVKRMVFHEITPSAIRSAVEQTRDLDRRLVDAQEARRILDRLYGYEVSPVLWKKVLPKLSAGRVQSVATRILVERERARMRFKPATYSGVEGTFAPEGRGSAEEGQRFGATLVALDGTRLATGRDFGETGELAGGAQVVVLDHDAAVALAGRLQDAAFSVRSVDEKPYRRSPYPPFLTSTLQQEAGRKLRFTSQRTMSVAQRLYENGYITYMRTDSTALSDAAVAAARAQATQLYGPQYVPDQPRRYERKVKNAQEAHEAIRPAGETFRTPDQVAAELASDELALYELIWKRTVASQMADARGKSVQVRLGATSSQGEDAEFSASGKVIEFPGFLRAYVEGSDDPDARLEDREVRLPALTVGDPLDALALEATDHTTQAPPRFTEASLVKALEELGVGRPSTYASIIATIQDRGYVWKKGAALVPSFTAFAVVQLLEHHFPDLVDYAFTARMEDDLDGIATGQEEAQPWLSRFYFGNGRDGLKAMVDERLDAIDAKAVNSIPIGTDADGREIVVRVGRYGPYLSRGEETAAIPDDLAPDELTVERAEELLAKPSSDRVLGTDPESGLPVIARAGRYGPYVQLGEGDAAAKQKPRTSSLLSGMTLDTVTLDDALKLLSLPRVVGVDPADRQEVTVQSGRYGPYVKKGSESRSLEDDDQLFTLTLDEALRVLAQPRRGRGQMAAAGPLRQLGTDPASGAPVELREGRFGPYVTDGTTNASLRAGDSPEEITLERAAELLQDRRERGPAKPRRGRAKKATKATKASKATKAAKSTKTAKATKARRAQPKVTGTEA
ncbi:MAG TPA: type I DNA topoisomerase [Acidimicrobiales bacterium]|nr:type I DNA topoisomerase [Acidimicrobiales bacterium]